MRHMQGEGLQNQRALRPNGFLLTPMVIEASGTGERAYDIYSRLLKDRIIFINGEIDSDVASAVIAQMLFLQLESEQNEISMYIMSPGGSVSASLAIYDVMQNIAPDVATYCIGEACSCAAFLLAAGAKGKRYALPASRIMIHQPWGGAMGSAKDIEIQASEMQRLKNQLYHRLALHTGKATEAIAKDCDRDFFMTAEEAKAYGIVDHIRVPKKNKLK